jgi:integrase
MPKANLTAEFVAQVESPASGRVYWMDIKLPGLALCVSSTGSKVFYFVGRGVGRPTRVKLEKFPKITVAKARELCVRVHADVAVGKPPVTRAARALMTVGDVWDWHLTHNLKPHNRTWGIDERTYNRECIQWAALPMRSLSRTMIAERKTEILNRGKPGAVNLFLSVMRGICKTAVAEGWADKNPAEQVRKCRMQKRARFLDEDEIGTFFTSLAKLKEDRQDYFMVVLFTAARKSNVCAMAWQDINFTRNTWIIPDPESKNKDPIYLPLARVVVEILVKRKAVSTSPWVFPGRYDSDHYKDPKRQWAKLLKDSGLVNLRIHDLRRTLASWQSIAGVSLQIIRDSLGQKSFAAALIYARLNDKTLRDSVQATADSITLVVAAKNSENESK